MLEEVEVSNENNQDFTNMITPHEHLLYRKEENKESNEIIIEENLEDF